MNTFMGANSSGTLVGVIQTLLWTTRQLLNTKKKRKFALLFLLAILLVSLMIRDDTDAVVEERLTSLYAKYNLSLKDFGHWNESRQSANHSPSGNVSSRFHSMLKNHSRIQQYVVADKIPKRIISFNFLTNQNASKRDTPVKKFVPVPIRINEKDIFALPLMKVPNVAENEKTIENQPKEMNGQNEAMKHLSKGAENDAKRQEEKMKIPDAIGAENGKTIVDDDAKNEGNNVKVGGQSEDTNGQNEEMNPSSKGAGEGEKRQEEIMKIPGVIERKPGDAKADDENEPEDTPKEEHKPIAEGAEVGKERQEEVMNIQQEIKESPGEERTDEEENPGDTPNEEPKPIAIPDAPANKRVPDSANEETKQGKPEDAPEDPKKSLKDKYKIGGRRAEGGGGGDGGEKGKVEKKPENMVTDQQGRQLKKELYDLAPEVFDFVPMEFEQEFKSSCWVDEHDASWCLPYFYIIGMPDTGSENLWQKLMMHPAIADTPTAGFHWWNRQRAREKDNRLESFKKFIHTGDGVIKAFGEDNFGMVYGDHSTSLFWDNRWWDQYYPGFTEAPPYTAAHVLGVVQPKAKLLLILTEPAETIYQNYLIVKGLDASPEDFDERCANSIDIFEDCLEKKSPRTCIYQPFDAKDKTIRLHWGFLSQYFEDWLKVFPLSQFHIVERNSFEKSCLIELPKIFSFLKLERLSMRKVRVICQAKSVLTRVPPPDSKPMQDTTKELLDAYYNPYFDKLDEILQKLQ